MLSLIVEIQTIIDYVFFKARMLCICIVVLCIVTKNTIYTNIQNYNICVYCTFYIKYKFLFYIFKYFLCTLLSDNKIQKVQKSISCTVILYKMIDFNII